ncbi:TBC1 domain family member 31-like [Montipora capricornis]|uniref:TBC1 domain family member 31-like n=1 Tax=Montipora capricornis TaxID=246305 RepID=UPI0035F1008C
MMNRGVTDKDRRRSSSKECEALRDLVNKLKLELLQSQVETQKVRDQLQCVIYLVRRAWQGDETASIHVSNIVGVAPPKIQRNTDLNAFTATPKSRALNSWARLVIGLLNRMYRQEELELRAKQLLYMRDREELLDEELMSLSPVKQHQTDASFVQANTLQLLQAKGEEQARERAEEREQLEQQRQELQAKFRKPVLFRLHSDDLARKDSVKRLAEFDSSEDLLITPVRQRSVLPFSSNQQRHVSSAQDLETDRLREGLNRSCATILLGFFFQSCDDVFLTRRRSNSTSRDEANVSKEKKKASRYHVRSQTSESPGKKTNLQQKPRPTTANVRSSLSSFSDAAAKRRPVSAHLSTQAKTWNKPPAFDSSKTKRQLDVIERDLKRTTKVLQERLGISKQGFV